MMCIDIVHINIFECFSSSLILFTEILNGIGDYNLD